ncbi:carboxypeptidase-like regulatory domain-containing protein [Flavivirga algicola]|uniref:Carboxypeptidase-like regulatory domain-containing protein n=1 Tax=Flavivirga algicola TaxID=2729136 RepID=A0ABX1S0P8_9FLAO|nr:carboxypeptidase-like regulatory domain-containing protein [Flavivirga algicola]NMH88820.1 hypothetical protein [Flavivirga algicola]
MKYFIFILLPFSMFSQNITGKVYDHEATVKGIKVVNLSKNAQTITGDDGHFTISASINDTLSFHSLFYNKKTIKLETSHFNSIMVVELKKIINRLNEVLIQKNKFNPENEKAQIKEQIVNDSKANPHLYDTYSNYGLDFVRVAQLIGKLFKKKKRKKNAVVLISHKAFDSLFSNHKLFNDEFLNKDLEIPKDYQQLFFEYCEAKSLNKKLLKSENEIILLDSLITYSNTFLKILEESKKNK